MSEPDDKIRHGYFQCDHKKCKSWLIPNGPDYPRGAARLDFKRYKIPICPGRYIWASTRMFFTSHIVAAALRYPETRIVSGGLLSQPANIGQLVEIVRQEIRGFRDLRAASKQKD
jgi:hypothetical protein